MFCIVSVRGGTWGAGGPHGRRGAVGRGATAPALVWFLWPSAWRRAGDGGQEPWRSAAGSRGASGLGGSRDTGAPGGGAGPEGGRTQGTGRSCRWNTPFFTHGPPWVTPACATHAYHEGRRPRGPGSRSEVPCVLPRPPRADRDFGPCTCVPRPPGPRASPRGRGKLSRAPP